MINIKSKHHLTWEQHGFALQIGDNVVDESAVPEPAQKRIAQLLKTGDVEIAPASDADVAAAKARADAALRAPAAMPSTDDAAAHNLSALARRVDELEVALREANARIDRLEDTEHDLLDGGGDGAKQSAVVGVGKDATKGGDAGATAVAGAPAATTPAASATDAAQRAAKK